MKVCPRCQKTYSDDNLNFCLEDGSVLNQMAASPPPQSTAPMSEPRPTAQPPQQAWNVQPQGQQYSMQPPKKSSKAWVWVLLILGVVILVCGGGIIGAFIYVGNKASEAANLLANANFNTSKTNRSTSNTTTFSSNSSRTSVDTLDLNNWVPENSKYAQIEFTDGELLVKNNDPKYYYVLAGTNEQKTVGADAAITVRNVNDSATNLGYGLVFHSMTTPLLQGYAFVIDAKKGRYRIVHHSPGKEDPVVNWTRSDAIKSGSSPNMLEARDGSGTVDLYINGQKVNTITNTYGYSDGVIGIYASSSIQVAFTDMQLRH